MPTMKSVQTAVPGTVEVAEIERPSALPQSYRRSYLSCSLGCSGCSGSYAAGTGAVT